MTIERIWIYPLKSGRRIEMTKIEYRSDRSGLQFDRRFMVIDANTGEMVSQRTKRMMATISPTIDRIKRTMTLSAPDTKETLTVGFEGGGEREEEEETNQPTIRRTKIWRVDLDGIDCGDKAAAWITARLNDGSDRVQKSYRLLRVKSALDRTVDPKYGTTLRKGERAGFQDGCHSLFANVRTAEAVAQRINRDAVLRAKAKGKTFPSAHYTTADSILKSCRPNFVVDAGVPYAEDYWDVADIDGKIELRPVRPCARCVMTTNDQDTGKSRPGLSLEPLVTLRKLRSMKDPAYGPTFGLYYNHHRGHGTISKGSSVLRIRKYNKTSVRDAIAVDAHFGYVSK